MTGKKRLRRITAFILALILILQGTGQYTIADGTQGRSIVSNVVYAAEGDSGQTTTSQKLQNGSFEDGENDQSWNGKNYNQPTQDKVPYWNTTASDKKIELFKNNSNTYILGVTLTPTAGNIAAELNAEEESTLYQNVTTTPASIYQWGLDHGARNGTDTMALVIGPSQPYDPSKPSKAGRDQLMQMVDWLIDNMSEDKLASVKYKNGAGAGKQIIVYSKKFGENGTFQNNEGNNAFSLTPSSIYTEEWHIWIIEDSKAESGNNPWGTYGSNAGGSAGSTDESNNTVLDTSKYYLYTVPSGQTKTLFGFVSVGYVNSSVSADKAKTFGNFLDNINFQIFHPLSGSTTLHGSGVVGGSDGTASGEGTSSTGYPVTVDNNLITYAVDGEPLKVKAVIKSQDADCEFVGLYYTTQDTKGNPKTSFLKKAGNEIDYSENLTEEQKNGKWIKSTNTDEDGDGIPDTVYTYYLNNITTATDLHFIFIKSPTVTYDSNGGEAYIVDRKYNTTEAGNVYSFKPVQDDSTGNSVDKYTFIAPYVSKAPEGQNDGWKFMGWLLTGDTVAADNIPEGTVQVNADKLGGLLLPAEHTIACDYTVGDTTSKVQYFKIWDNRKNLTGVKQEEDEGELGERDKGVKWNLPEGDSEAPVYANVHVGITMVAQWRWLQVFIPQKKVGDEYAASAEGGTVSIVSVNESDENYNGSYGANGGKSYHAVTDEVITVKAKANAGYVFEGWYDSDGKLLTTKDTYTYTEAKGAVNTFHARFSGSVTQTFIRQVKEGDNWKILTDNADMTYASLDCYSYSDAAGTTASSTAKPSAGYRFAGWYDGPDASANPVSGDWLRNKGSTITYTTTGNAIYYARFEPIPVVPVSLTKIWEDNENAATKRPSDITVKLYADYDGIGGADRVELDASKYTLNWDKSTNPKKWTATITGLPRYTASGTELTEIIYSLEETDVEHYVNKIAASKPSSDNEKWQFTITNTLELVIGLKKVDKADDKPLGGTRFRLYKAEYNSDTSTFTAIPKDDSTEYTEYITDETGYIHIPILQTGAYELVETEAITGYELGDKPFDCFFKVGDADFNKTIDITSGTAASKESRTTVDTSFFVVESGYELLTETGLTNARKTGTLVIDKRDGDTGTALDGVKFTLYKENDDSTYGEGWEFTTGSKYDAFAGVKESTTGVTTIENLPWGNYKLVETATLDGYILTSDEYFFTVSKDNVSSPIKLTDISNNVITDNVITNDRNKIQFIKQSDDAAPVELTGGSYRIMKVTGETRQEVSFYKDAEGADGLQNRLTAGDTVYGLAAGKYEIEEITAPYGYKLKSTPVSFVMDEQGIAKKTDNTAWSDNKIIMQDEPIQIALKKIDGDTGLTVTGAKFKLTGIFAENGVKAATVSTIENLTVDNFTEQLKGKLIASTGNEEGVDCFTYSLLETEAPVGYAPLTEAVQFRLTASGKIELVNSSAMTNVNNEAAVPEIIVKNSAAKYSFEVTKVFVEDGTWKNTIRPSQVSIQLYSQIEGTTEKVEVGSPVVFDITTDKDSYSYTYNNLPAYNYVNENGVSVPKKILYSVEEKAVLPEEKAAYYRTDYSTVTESESGSTYYQTITNTAADHLPAGVLKISKTNIGGELEDTFQIKVTLSQGGKETVFKDSYEVYKSDNDNDASNDERLRTVSASEGYVELKGGEYAKLVLPKGVNYYIEEVLKTYGDRTLYAPSYSAQSGVIRENDTVEALIVNKANIYTAIENGTENLGISYQGGNNPKNAGGTVGVVAGDGSNKEAYDKVDYEEGKLSVYWMPMTDWSFTDSFTVIYSEHNGSGEGSEEKSITVTDFLDENGSAKAASDECYSVLRTRYPDMGIEQNDAGAIILKLANTGEGMPYLNKVLVSFMPTVAVINTTKDNAGGQVKAEKGQYSNIADGKGVHGENRYPVTTVYAKADEGYSIDLSKLTIGNAGTMDVTEYQTPSLLFAPSRVTADKKVLSLTSDNSFSISLPYSMAGTADDYSIQGRVEILATQDEKPVGIAIILNGLSIPVDIGVEFVRSETPDEPGEDDGISFVITKKFIQDDIWKNTIRPSQVSLQLYSKIEGAEEVKVGNPVVLDINTRDNSYSYTFNNLPEYYYDEAGVSEPVKISYFVRETDNQPDGRTVYYRAEYSAVSEGENTYSQTITNTAADLLPVGTLKISKTNIGGASGAVFKIKVTLSYGGSETVFKDTYKVYAADGDTDASNDSLLRTATASNGYVELKGGEYVELILPKGVSYHIEEILDSVDGTVQYIPTYTGQDGTIIENSLVEASIINRANIYTAIANDTENEGSSYQDDTRPKNAGGTVGVVIEGGSDKEDYGEVDYQEGKMSVYWMPMTDWCFTDSFTVTYREYDGSAEGGVEKSITVSGFLDGNGTPKDVSDACYDELRARYTDMEIGQNDDGTIILRLADTVDGMPYLSKVDVAFTPTVAIINTTEKNAGGQVKAENGQYSDIADGKGVQGEKRYPDTKVYAKADKDYYIDLSHITIGNVDTIALGRQNIACGSPFIAFAAPAAHISMLTSSEELELGDDNSFDISLPYVMAGSNDYYSIHGRVEVLDSQNGKPTEIAIILEGLSIPVDVGIKFDKTSTSEEPSGEEPSGENPSGENPSGENPSGENPSGENPSGENPSGENPSGEDPSGENPSGEDQSGEEPSGEEPSREDQSEEPSGETETAGETSGEAAGGEESSVEPSTEQPTEGEGTYEAPSTGSTSNKWYYAFLVLICGLGTVIFTKKRSPKKADK